MVWWNKLVEFFGFEARELPTPAPKKRKKPAAKKPWYKRLLPGENVSRETPKPKPKPQPRALPKETQEKYTATLSQLRDERKTKSELESIMFNDSLPRAERKDALDEWTRMTGWYRPSNNNHWSSEEWKKWEEIYEAEPELW